MVSGKRVMVGMAVILGFALAAGAQFMREGPPPLLGAFNPVLGSGAQYQVTTRDHKATWTYAVVGKEKVESAEGYWLEMRMVTEDGKGSIMKHLIVMRGDVPDIKRMILQMPGQPPMEMPMGMMGGMMERGMPERASAGKGDLGEKIGTETITVPAGTFLCDHYRTKSEAGTGDVWLSTKVPPYGMVKMTSQDVTMVLQKVLSNETSQIKGSPQKMDFRMPQIGVEEEE